MLDPADMSRLLHEARNGDARAADRLFPVLYDELRGLARHYLGQERAGHTMQPTALVNEAYLRFVNDSQLEVEDRSHFLSLGARVLRQVLVDHARRKRADKRGGDWLRVSFEHIEGFTEQRGIDVLALDEALGRLAMLDERKSRVVELRFFAGLSMEEIAAILDVSKRSVEADWFMARAWLRAELDETPDRGEA